MNEPKDGDGVRGVDLIYEYFRLVKEKNIHNLLDLFKDDAVIYEPFSKIDDIRGKPAIESFLTVVMMASDSLTQSIVIERGKNGYSSPITALATFEKGDKLKGRFTFEIDSVSNSNTIEAFDSKKGKIKALLIHFI